MATKLSEQNRSRLDGIVQQMSSNGESDSNIQTVVNDFKTRYGDQAQVAANPTLDSGVKPATPMNPSNLLPTAGAVIGGTLGSIAGGAAAAPTVAGVPIGAYAGGVAGTAAGAAIGTEAQQLLNKSPTDFMAAGKNALGFGGLEAVGGPLLSAGSKVLQLGGEAVAKAFIPKSNVEAGLLQAYKAGKTFPERVFNALKTGKSGSPSTAASTAFQQGIAGFESMMGVQAKRAQTKLWTGLVKPALDQSKVKVDIPAFLKEAEAKIVKETNDPTRAKVLTNALKAVQEDFKGIEKVSLAQLQKYKEGWAEFVPEKAYKGQPIAGALNDVRNTLADMARNKIYTTLGNDVKQAYFDYGNLHAIAALGRKATIGAIQGGTGTSLKAILEKATVPIGTLAGQAIYKVGDMAEIIGLPGARTIRDALGIPLSGTGQPPASPTQSGSQPSTPPISTPPVQ